MKKFFITLLVIAILLVAAWLILSFLGLWPPWGGGGSGDSSGDGYSETPPTQSVDELPEDPPIDELPVEENIPGEPPSLYIDIREDSIEYDGRAVSLGELADILDVHNDPEYVWELRDVQQADRTVYNAVVELLNERGIAFRES